MDWIYLASASQTSLVDTIQAVLRDQLLWRPAHRKDGTLIPHVGELQEADRILLSWRDGADAHAYLSCRVAAPLRALKHRGTPLIIDRVSSADANGLVCASYQANADGDFEVIRLADVAECYFALGRYGGNNAIHRLADADRPALAAASPLPPHAVTKETSRRASAVKHSARAAKLSSSRAPNASHDLAVRLEGSAGHRVFDAYVMVDWSSSATPTTRSGWPPAAGPRPALSPTNRRTSRHVPRLSSRSRNACPSGSKRGFASSSVSISRSAIQPALHGR